ncbi:LLM class flavin-dependent oxidoreductase [Actinomadura chibensis]|uniref:LLM class flavin-dependent oxidoreductase n=1 Tax=Actinomadura chibensis TaxID=392828 RepID=A0A5D0NM14_9ACTN|nr:LLM class flavin-dependent oxidoreductase [Actinomadura chibensis]TYB45445.1 LLM class flavin-dependent oxidoreductase [Actinomadura chibensis]
MDIGIGLPGHGPWTDGRLLIEWARRAEARGFAGLATSDRLLWPTPEPLTTLAAAAGATSRIRLLTSVVLAPLRTNHLLFAKSAITLDRLAGPHRLRLGLVAGFREDDFAESGVDYATRGKRFTALLDELEAAGRDDTRTGLTPATPGGPELLFGGTSAAALDRIAARGSGWVAGTSSVEDIAEFTPRLREAWDAAGRTGAPKVVVSAMFALGPNARTAVADAIGPYYAFAGAEWAEHGIATALTTPEQVREAVADFRRAGCDELVFTGNDPDPAQVDLLADALSTELGG